MRDASLAPQTRGRGHKHNNHLRNQIMVNGNGTEGIEMEEEIEEEEEEDRRRKIGGGGGGHQ
jgi:hypothetical protein